MRLLLFLFFMLLTSSLAAQKYDWDDFVEEYASDVERAEEEDLQLHLQELKELSEHPMNINTATVEDFLQLPFLSEAQIEQIHAYIYLHGQLQTLAELRLVPLIDDMTRRWLSLFTYAEPQQQETDKRLFSHLRHDFSSRIDIPLYYRVGQQQENGYRGDPLYHRIRYQLGNSRHFQAGLRVEKDAGERFYDSYGAYAMLHDVGILDKAVVGDYRIGFGEGLVLGGSTWNSKSTPPLKTQGGIRPMAGMDETNFLRGAAVTLSLSKHLKLSTFGSYRKRDATLTSRGEVQTLRTDGYHRTASEWEKKRNVGSAVVGGNIAWYNKGLHLGATGYWQKFSRDLNPGTQQYRAIYPKGNSFGVAGLNYGYTRYRLTFAGETAYSTAGGGWATINRASWNISKNYILSAVQRFYAYQYYSQFAERKRRPRAPASGALCWLATHRLCRLLPSSLATLSDDAWQHGSGVLPAGQLQHFTSAGSAGSLSVQAQGKRRCHGAASPRQTRVDVRGEKQNALPDNRLLPQCLGQERLLGEPKRPILAAEAKPDPQRTARLLQHRRLPQPHLSAVAGFVQYVFVKFILWSRHAGRPDLPLEKQEREALARGTLQPASLFRPRRDRFRTAANLQSLEA